jgi:hypothetical protein
LTAVVAFFVLTGSAWAATWYVDSSVASSGNGQSWATAWKNISNMTGVSAGDTVYISGGPSGSSQTYSLSGAWPATSGTSGSPITYKIGQDANHNGTAYFSGSGIFFNASTHDIIFSGDAGDASRHFSLANPANNTSPWSGVIYCQDTMYNVRFSYVNLGMFSGAAGGYYVYSFYGNHTSTGDGIEIDHTWTFDSNMNADAFAHFSSTTPSSLTTWGANLKFHDNVFYSPTLPGGLGADGVQATGDCQSLYNNVMISYNTSSYSGSQHADAWQTLGGDYGQFYNNVVYNFYNSNFYLDGAYSGINFEHWRIFNNIIIANTVVDGGLICGPGAAITIAYNDIIIANNTIDSAGACAISLNNANSGAVITWVGDLIANNACINNTITIASVNSYQNTTPVIDSPTISASQAASYFVNYVARSTNSNYRLTSSATSLIGKGTNLYAYASSDSGSAAMLYDFAGNARPSSGAWDIGAYQYATSAPGTNPVIQVSPSSLSFGSVMAGASATNSFTVQNAGGGTLAGTATVAAPFEILSGGTYSLGSNQSQTVSVIYTPSGPNDSQVVTFTGGGGATATVSGNLLVVQSGLSFPSYAGTITAPFSTNGGFVSQSVLTTDVASGGSASFYFNITNPGQYIVEASVLAANAGSKSFWVNIDALPIDPTMVWDIYPYSTNWQTVPVSWRGNSTTITNDQYNPEVFTLTSGVHDLIIVGREANVGLGQITIAPYTAGRPTAPAPPQGFRVVASQ